VVRIDELLDFFFNPGIRNMLETFEVPDQTLEVSLVSFGEARLLPRRNRLAIPAIEALEYVELGRGSSTWKFDDPAVNIQVSGVNRCPYGIQTHVDLRTWKPSLASAGVWRAQLVIPSEQKSNLKIVQRCSDAIAGTRHH